MMVGQNTNSTQIDHAKAVSALLQWWQMNGVEIPPITNQKATQNQPNNTPSPAPIALALPQNISNPDIAREAAQDQAQNCKNLIELKECLAQFEGCALKNTATQLVFGDGVENAPIMVIGEAPGREEDEQGKPFVSIAGQLLDKMFASIGLSRNENLYLTNCVNWRPPGNRTPTQEEIAILLPFLQKHIELKSPKAIILVGSVAANAVLQTKEGIGKLRKLKHKYKLSNGIEIPLFCMFHPSYLLRRPIEKSSSWKDLLSIKGQIKSLLIGDLPN